MGPRRRGRCLGRPFGGCGDLEAPSVAAVGPEAEIARLRVVDEDAVAGAGKQPRHREVGRVVASPEPPLGNEGVGYERPLLGLVGTLPGVVLDHVAALVDGVGALAEAEVALAAAGAEADPHGVDAEARSNQSRVEADHALAARAEANGDRPAGVSRGEGSLVKPVAPP